MAFGIQLFNSAGTVIYDTTTVMGGVAGDYQQVAAGAGTSTLSYPQWAGFSAFILDGYGNGYGTASATLSMSSGYPVVTLASSPVAFAFVLVIY